MLKPHQPTSRAPREVDAQRRRAEQDKAMALSALEERERDCSRQEEAVRRLEERVRRMSADMLQPAEGADAEERRTGLESSKLEEQRLGIEEEKLQVPEASVGPRPETT